MVMGKNKLKMQAQKDHIISMDDTIFTQTQTTNRYTSTHV